MALGVKTVIQVWCTCQFAAFHYWKDAPLAVVYLRNPHRHIFHVKAWKIVKEEDREVEFIQLKNTVQGYVKAAYEGKTFEYSCEHIAKDVALTCKLDTCEVSEDGENGAIVSVLRKD